VKRQLGHTAHCFAKTVCAHEQTFAMPGTGFMKSRLLGIGLIVRKLVLGNQPLPFFAKAIERSL
jgi:hypothetical protein